MGYYINPKDQSKEDWIEAHGVKISEEEARDFFKDHAGDIWLPVCLVENPTFSALGVGFDEHEIQRFTRPGDLRYREYYMVELALLDEEVGLPGFADWYKSRK